MTAGQAFRLAGAGALTALLAGLLAALFALYQDPGLRVSWFGGSLLCQ